MAEASYQPTLCKDIVVFLCDWEGEELVLGGPMSTFFGWCVCLLNSGRGFAVCLFACCDR